jgi:hypothetical protein
VALWWRGVDTEFNKGLARFLGEALPAWFAETQQAFAGFWPQLEKDFADLRKKVEERINER